MIAGAHIFGEAGAKVMALFICLGLVSSVSGMMWIGPRITAAMGEDLRILTFLARRNSHGVPVSAILAQYAIVVVMLLTATFQNAVNYVQFSLTLCSTLTVLGVFVLRWRRPDLPRPYRTWGYPVTPLIFLGISIWMLEHMLADSSTRAPRSGDLPPGVGWWSFSLSQTTAAKTSKASHETLTLILRSSCAPGMPWRKCHHRGPRQFLAGIQ